MYLLVSTVELGGSALVVFRLAKLFIFLPHFLLFSYFSVHTISVCIV